ncbi:hypothetical protein AMECASPLE_002558 [Ameca splendens]|uniref:Uncharacterized protein n=1 Tax=Ameca splendens TaxID=208324 RepID=A0ABV1A5Q8_9TELE
MLTLIKTGHPEEGHALSSLAFFVFLCLWRSDNPRKLQEAFIKAPGGGPRPQDCWNVMGKGISTVLLFPCFLSLITHTSSSLTAVGEQIAS